MRQGSRLCAEARMPGMFILTLLLRMVADFLRHSGITMIDLQSWTWMVGITSHRKA